MRIVSGTMGKHLRVLAVLLACLMLFAVNSQMASAMWAQRPPVIWLKSPCGKYEAKWITKTGEVTVFVFGKRKAPLWSAKLTEYHEIFSDVRLTGGGKYIVHIRGNMQAMSLKATAAEIVTPGEAPRAPKGKIGLGPRPLITSKVKVEAFIDKLKGLKRAANGMILHVSDGPQSRWLQRVNTVTDTTLTLINANGKPKTLNLATGKVVQNKVISGKGYRLIPIAKREHGYNGFKTQVIQSVVAFRAFKRKIEKQNGWNGRDAFMKALVAAEIDFSKEVLMLVRHAEGSGSIGVSLAPLRLLKSGELVCNIQRTPLKAGMDGTADMAYYCYALAIRKEVVRKVQLQVAGRERKVIEITGDPARNALDIRKLGPPRAMPARIAPLQVSE